MPAAKLPKRLSFRLNDLVDRVRRIRTLKALARAVFVVPVMAFIAILLDAYLGLPVSARVGLFVAWLLLLAREIWNVRRSRTSVIELRDIASAVEAEYPRLAERLTTAVELAESSDLSNGNPALIEEVIYDAEARTKKLDLTAAIPAGGAGPGLIAATILLAGFLVASLIVPRSGEHLRRFFAAWYAPTVKAPFRIVVTSGDQAVKRNDAVTMSAYLEPTKPDAMLPASVTVIVTIDGKEERLSMSSSQHNVWHAQRTGTNDFEYRIEAGVATSETHRVVVVDPVAVTSARVTITPPAYAAKGREVASIEGLGEITALQHSRIDFELKFQPKPTKAWVEFKPTSKENGKSNNERQLLVVGDDGVAKFQRPALQSGSILIVAEATHGVRTELPAQPLHVNVDEAPKLPSIRGISEAPRKARPTERLSVECAAIDDVSIDTLVLEWRINEGAVQQVPFDAKDLKNAQVQGKATLSFVDRAKTGDRIYLRIAATDNRNVPEAKLAPQTTYYPAKDWSELTLDPDAEPLAEQDINQRRLEIANKLKDIQADLKAEARAANRLRAEVADGDAVQKLRNDVEDTTRKVDDLARDVAVTPETSRLADQIRRVSEEPLRDADSALATARDEKKRDTRRDQLTKADDALNRALKKVDELLEENDRLAKERLDRRKLEGLSEEQRSLAEKARQANEKDAAALAAKQAELEKELQKLRESSEAIRNADAAARNEETKKIADSAKKLAEEMREANEAIRRGQQTPESDRLAELKKKQEELARKTKELSEKTDAATRAAQSSPINPADAVKAKEALERGNFDEAATAAEKARQELERAARDLESASGSARDAREAAKQLARLQEDLRQRVAQETAKTPLDKLPAERRTAIEAQQDAIRKAIAELKVPDQATDAAKQLAARDAKEAVQQLQKGAKNGADRKMQETRQDLENLAERLPSREQRVARARDELARLKQQQEELRLKADAAVKSTEKQDPDSPATQRELAKKVADSARKQADLMDQLGKLDLPGQEGRQQKVARAMQQATTDLTEGRAQDIGASQQKIRREIERLEQAMSGQLPVDERIADAAKKQRELADEAHKAAPDRPIPAELARRQEDIAREAAKLQAPEASTASSDVADATKKAADAGRELAPAKEMAKRAREAADKLSKLDEQVNGPESAREMADRLAKRQKDNADSQAKKADNASTGEARKKATQQLEELKNTRTGADSQKAKQQAQDALQRASNTIDPQANSKAQREAADALKDLAETLNRQQKAERPAIDPKVNPEEEVDRLAKKQRESAEQTKKDLDGASKKPADEAKKARQEARDQARQRQQELSDQLAGLDGKASPRDMHKAQEAMRDAREELDRENFEGAMQKQRDAADALDRLTREQKKQRDQLAQQHPDLPTRQQAEEARQLADEQRKLRDEAMRAAEEHAKDAARRDNPLADVVKQQREIAREADELAKQNADRQGAKAESTKQASEAASSAQKAADEVRNGNITPAKVAGEQAEKQMQKLGSDPSGGDSAPKARDLARRQGDLNRKLGEMANDSAASRAQQQARQQELEQSARDIGKSLEGMAKEQGDGDRPAGKAAANAKESAERMEAAQKAMQRGDRNGADAAREGAQAAMERAASQAREAAEGTAPSPGSTNAGRSIGDARQRMEEAASKLGKGAPKESAGSMEKAADALQQAAGQLSDRSGNRPGGPMGKNDQPSNSQGDGTNPGGNFGGKLDLTQFGPDAAKYNGKSWGELPGEIKNKVIQDMKARYGEDYARNIKLYFEQLAERK